MKYTPIFVSIFMLIFAAATYSTILAAEPKSMAQAEKEVREYYKSGEWERDVAKKYEEAKNIVDKYDGDPKKATIVFDIDETLVTSLPYFEQHCYIFDKTLPQWSKWVLDAKSPKIEAALNFYNYAKEKGYRLVILTGRREDQRSLTERNLKNAGYTEYAALYMRDPDKKQPTSIFKQETRKKMSEDGEFILLNIGDQKSDLEGGYSKYQIKLPNPIYAVP